ncbi:MAG: dTDP-4-dehydrorhamnose 3,5-epimerase family protein [Methanospirillum sp.]|uniref:dTDP-4-dehydrorhamnose 3,5-epimerase family protein n=1 Tax=Methanospirillum sp. TaxID=45200 RepID=UPI002370B03E|nr:dTDP-4-dehydrorhamnose 3,5-epimerase family protein [Methanospirillum sp.]MDD1729113.1 dTDP-4-dehydrorhamnose 3,5-epimerase family protein [Methanospirillum sp.]
MIEGVSVKPLRQILDERGKVMHMLRCDDLAFLSFGEMYFSIVYPGAIKGWHNHKKMTLNIAVPYGAIKLVLYDERESSKTRGEIQEIFLGPENYCLVRIPPRVWNGFKGIGLTQSLVADCSTIPYDPEEIDRKDPLDPSIPYTWELINK